MGKNNGTKPTVIFDLSKCRARDFRSLENDVRTNNLRMFPKAFAMTVTQTTLGPSDEADTYRQLGIDAMGELIMQFQSERKILAEKVEKEFDAQIDLSGLDFAELEDLQVKVQRQINSVNDLAGLMAKYVVKTVPSIEGELNDPETYLNLPYYGEFNYLTNRLHDTFREAMENFMRKYIFQ